MASKAASNGRARTRPGDVLTVHGEIVEVAPSQSRPDCGTIVVSVETRNQRGDLVQSFTATLLVPNGPPPLNRR